VRKSGSGKVHVRYGEKKGSELRGQRETSWERGEREVRERGEREARRHLQVRRADLREGEVRER